MALWQTKSGPQTARKDETAKSVAESKNETAVVEERKAVLKLLGLPEHWHSAVRSNGDDYLGIDLFAAFVNFPDEDVVRVLGIVTTERLEPETSAVEVLGNHLKVDRRDYREADDTFLDLLCDKTAVNAMLFDIVGKRVANVHVTATTKVQKKIIRDPITGSNKAEGW